MEERARIMEKMFEIALSRAHSTHTILKGKEGEKIWNQMQYFLYRWEKTLNPLAVKPFNQETDQLQEDYKALKGFFESGEGLRIQG